MIEIGKRYRCKIRPEHHFTIIAKDQNKSERPFLGISDDGRTEMFFQDGRSKWFEFGGSWWSLDLSESFPPKYALTRIEESKE